MQREDPDTSAHCTAIYAPTPKVKTRSQVGHSQPSQLLQATTSCSATTAHSASIHEYSVRCRLQTSTASKSLFWASLQAGTSTPDGDARASTRHNCPPALD